MHTHVASDSDLNFQQAFETGDVKPGDFNHVAHLRLAYVYLVEGGPAQAHRRMRESVLTFLGTHGVPTTKYHETLTRAWVMAVSHFMNRKSSTSFSEFAAISTPLLDSKVMLTHYSAAALFSERARAAFVEPDLEAIPG